MRDQLPRLTSVHGVLELCAERTERSFADQIVIFGLTLCKGNHLPQVRCTHAKLTGDFADEPISQFVTIPGEFGEHRRDSLQLELQPNVIIRVIFSGLKVEFPPHLTLEIPRFNRH